MRPSATYYQRGRTCASTPRLHLGAELRRHREEARLRSNEVAAQLGISPSKISRWETGVTRVPESDLSVLMDLYGVDGSQRATLLLLSRDAGLRGWWEDYNDILLPGIAQMVALEQQATRILVWEPDVVPPLMQTEAYARALITARRQIEPIAPTVINRAVTACMRRQQPAARQIQVVIAEAALRHRVGSHEVMEAQLARLATPPANTEIRVIPADAHRPVVTPGFTLASFTHEDYGGDLALPDQVGIELLTGTTVINGIHDSYLYRLTWMRLNDAAADVAASRKLIRATVQRLAPAAGRG